MAPGVLLVVALALLSASASTLILGYTYLGWAVLAVAAIVLVKVPLARSDCQGKAGLSPHGGGQCPKCGTNNPVRLWSL